MSSKAQKLATLSSDVNELADLADQVTEIENAISRANTNAQEIDSISDSLEELSAINSIYNSGISYSTDGVNEYFDANTPANTLASTEFVEMNIQSPQEGDLMSFDAAANNWINSTATVQLESFRNKIINGDMRIDQRNAGANTTIFSYGYGIDRWGYQCFGGGEWSSQRTTVVPSVHKNSLGLTVTNADVSIGSTDVYQLFQKVEGFNAADLGFGTANPKTITVSFWVRSSIIGTYSASFQNNGFNRGYIATFEVNAVDTWEYKTLTVIGDDTSGTWTIDNSIGLQFAIDLGSGSGSNITAGSWQTVTTSSLRTSGSVDWVGTLGATFYITGVQLEEGEVATPFEQRPYGVEEQLCKRYWCWGKFKVGGRATTGSGNRDNIFFSTTMRVHPTVYLSNEVKNGIGTTYPEIGGPNHFTVYWLGSVSSDNTTYYSEYSADAEL